ncbi:hypothetical protein BDV93DRAFT_338308 [Ceratobasidium sp. AG-I]|nr:hypothetical protein BDV93DRAFT_338308 [Ceratobasidium sp. AG-I]
MSTYDGIWGPEIHHYSLGFDLDAPESSSDLLDPSFYGVWEGAKVIPVKSLENNLSRSDLRKGYCYGDRPLAALISTLQTYHEANNNRIFKNYYGFLFIRCIMHIICVGVLLETKTLDFFLESLDQNLDWKQVCSSIAHETMRQAVSSIRPESDSITRSRFQAVFQSHKVLPSVRGITANDCTLILRLLWEDRASFLTLCELELLPGGPNLLYTLSRILVVQPMSSADMKPLLMIDLCVRQYLFSFNRDKLGRQSRSGTCIHPTTILATPRRYYCPDVRFGYHGDALDHYIERIASRCFNQGRKPDYC